MTEDMFYALLNAKETLCGYCENKDKCISCQVTAIIDNAQCEAVMMGLIDNQPM